MGKEIEGLEHQTKMQTVLPNGLLTDPFLLLAAEKSLAIYDDFSFFGGFQKVQAAQKGGLAAAGGADDAQHLPFFQGEGDVFQHVGAAKAFLNVLYFQNCHCVTP